MWRSAGPGAFRVQGAPQVVRHRHAAALPHTDTYHKRYTGVQSLSAQGARVEVWSCCMCCLQAHDPEMVTEVLRVCRRLRVRKDLLAKATVPVPDASEPAGADGEDEDAKEAALLAEMAKVKETAERRLKKEKKRKREAKIKARVRAAQMALGEQLHCSSISVARQNKVGPSTIVLSACSLPAAHDLPTLTLSLEVAAARGAGLLEQLFSASCIVDAGAECSANDPAPVLPSARYELLGYQRPRQPLSTVPCVRQQVTHCVADREGTSVRHSCLR